MEFIDGHLDLDLCEITRNWSCSVCGKSGDVWTYPQDFECKYVQDPMF